MADYATLLNDHVTLTCRCVDRVFLQAYVPQLQAVGQVCNFLHHRRGFKIPSSAAFGQLGKAYVSRIEQWAQEHNIPVRRFKKGENKEGPLALAWRRLDQALDDFVSKQIIAA